MDQIWTLRPSELSATISQCTLKYRQARLLWGISVATHNQNEQRGTTGIGFRSSMTTLAMDVIAGSVIGVILWLFPEAFISPIAEAHTYLNEEVLKSMVSWLMDSPVGLQLNRNLAIFLGTISLTMISYWEELIKSVGLLFQIPENVMTLSMILSVISFFGASILLSIIIDLSSFLSFHVLFVYAGLSRFWKLWLEVAYTLTNLFRGKKYNVLKSRTDAHEFDIEQLILGTVFLSISMFIMPTVFVFFVSFLTIWAFLLSIQFVARCVIYFLTFFPGYLWLIAGSIPYETILVPPPHGGAGVQMLQRSLSRRQVLRDFLRVFRQNGGLGRDLFILFLEILKGTKLLFARYIQHEFANMHMSASNYSSLDDWFATHVSHVTTKIDKLD